MRKVAVVTAILLAVAGGATSARAAVAEPGDTRPCWQPWRAAYARGDVRPVKRMIRCWAQLTNLSARRSLAIAECESHFRPDAEYRGSVGVFQHNLRWWDHRLSLYAPDLAGGSPWNAWVNVALAFRYASVNGWVAWSCA